MSEPTVTCALCARSRTVVPDGRGFPPDIAKRKLAKDCQADGCPCEPVYRAGVSLSGPATGQVPPLFADGGAAGRDVPALRVAMNAWYKSMPDGWQDSYTEQGRLVVAYTHGWDDRMNHDDAVRAELLARVRALLVSAQDDDPDTEFHRGRAEAFAHIAHLLTSPPGRADVPAVTTTR